MFGLGGAEIGGLGFVLFIILGFLLPFLLNASLARSRGKSVALMLLLTLFFSWIVTLILAFLPKVDGNSTQKATK